MEGRLGDAQHRRIGQLTRGVEARVAEAGDDHCVEGLALRQLHLLGHAGRAEHVVEMAFDGDRPEARLPAHHLCACSGHGTRGLDHGLGHRAPRCWG